MEQFRVNNNKSIDEETEQSASFFSRVKLFLRRSTLFQMIFLFAFVLLFNDLVIDFMHRERIKFNENLTIDSFFGSLIKMPAIMLTWYLIEQRIGRRWSNCTILCLNFVVLIAAMLTRWWPKKEPWLGVTISMLGSMMAECSTLITILQIIELSPTRFRMLVLGLAYSIGKLASICLVYAFHLHSVSCLVNKIVGLNNIN